MVKRKEFWIMFGLTLITALSTFLITYILFVGNDVNKNPINDTETKVYTLSDDIKKQTENIEQIEKNTEVIAVTEPHITPSTKLVYEYYYEGDGNIKTVEEIPPYFLIDMTRKDIEQKYPDWQLKSFSQSQVIMRKSIPGKVEERYIIGEYNGFVAVFYEQPIDGVSLRELTDTPVSSLTKEDQNKLKIGISIFGDEALMKALQDYES